MTDEEKARVADQLRTAIAASDLTPSEIARRSGVSRSFLSRFISGERGISLESAEEVAAALGMRLLVKKKR